ncbi:unnamed protein product [Rhodiola kirilowii]
MENSKEQEPVFLDRSSRGTRGKRMTKLLDEEVEEDELFWNQEALKDEVHDDNYEEEAEVADEFDSDFDEDEPEPDEEGEKEPDERTAVVVRQAERDAIQAAIQATVKPIIKKKKEGEEKRMTQEEMLLEAAQTEIMNMRNLERLAIIWSSGGCPLNRRSQQLPFHIPRKLYVWSQGYLPSTRIQRQAYLMLPKKLSKSLENNTLMKIA